MTIFLRICLLAVFYLPISLSGQNSKSCKLVDSETGDPVAYASISAGSFFIYSDIDGIFPLQDLPNGKVNISRLGYKSLTIDKEDLSSKILMVSEAYSLNELLVTANPTVFEVGYSKYKTTGKAVMSKKTALGVYIEYPGRNARIVNVHWVCKLFSVRAMQLFDLQSTARNLLRKSHQMYGPHTADFRYPQLGNSPLAPA